MSFDLMAASMSFKVLNATTLNIYSLSLSISFASWKTLHAHPALMKGHRAPFLAQRPPAWILSSFMHLTHVILCLPYFHLQLERPNRRSNRHRKRRRKTGLRLQKNTPMVVSGDHERGPWALDGTSLRTIRKFLLRLRLKIIWTTVDDR